MAYGDCDDCGLSYYDPRFACMVVPNKIWNEVISPAGNEGGTLCPNCIIGRIHKAKLKDVPVFFASRSIKTMSEEEFRKDNEY